MVIGLRSLFSFLVVSRAASPRSHKFLDKRCPPSSSHQCCLESLCLRSLTSLSITSWRKLSAFKGLLGLGPSHLDTLPILILRLLRQTNDGGEVPPLRSSEDFAGCLGGGGGWGAETPFGVLSSGKNTVFHTQALTSLPF